MNKQPVPNVWRQVVRTNPDGAWRQTVARSRRDKVVAVALVIAAMKAEMGEAD